MKKLCFLMVFFVFGSIYAKGAGGSDSFEDDDTFHQAKPILYNDDTDQYHTFHDEGDTDWVKFYAKAGYPIQVRVRNTGTACDAVIKLYYRNGTTLLTSVNYYGAGEDEVLTFSCQENGEYYAVISNYDPSVFGANTGYDLKVDDGGAPGAHVLIFGSVTDANTSVEIDGAEITTNGAGAGVSDGGEYELMQVEGSFTISAQRNCYTPYSASLNAEVPDLQHDISMNPTGDCDGIKGDLNKNGIVDFPDLQPIINIFLEVGEPTDYQLWAADVNNDGKVNVSDIQLLINMLL